MVEERTDPTAGPVATILGLSGSEVALLHRCGFWEEGAAGQFRLRLVSRKTQKFGREAESRRRGQMSYTREVLDDVRAQLAPEDTVIKEARERRDASKAAGESFPGALRSYNSGSLAHGTANCPVHQRDKGLDADCGVVLDRRAYPTLGPDVFGGEGPVEIVEEMRLHVLGELRRDYPKVEAETTKRAILLTFHEPFRDGEDPTVDLVVGLTDATPLACGFRTPSATLGTRPTRRSTPSC
jgi:hypothetical protein